MNHKIKPFTRFKEIFHFYFKQSKKWEASFEKDAINWFKDFGAVFGSQSNCNCKGKITWHYSGGILFFGFPNLGDYNYVFVIEMIHYELWRNNDFIDGFKFGRKVAKNKIQNDGRDSNPHDSLNFISARAWDAGYICGLSNVKLLNPKPTTHDTTTD